jgi:hypothetical protein
MAVSTAPFLLVAGAYEVSRFWVERGAAPSALPPFVQKSLIWTTMAGLHWIPALTLALVLAPLIVLLLVGALHNYSDTLSRMKMQAAIWMSVGAAAWLALVMLPPPTENNPGSWPFVALWSLVMAEGTALACAVRLQQVLRQAGASSLPAWPIVVLATVFQIWWITAPLLAALVPLVLSLFATRQGREQLARE